MKPSALSWAVLAILLTLPATADPPSEADAVRASQNEEYGKAAAIFEAMYRADGKLSWLSLSAICHKANGSYGYAWGLFTDIVASPDFKSLKRAQQDRVKADLKSSEADTLGVQVDFAGPCVGKVPAGLVGRLEATRHGETPDGQPHPQIVARIEPGKPLQLRLDPGQWDLVARLGDCRTEGAATLDIAASAVGPKTRRQESLVMVERVDVLPRDAELEPDEQDSRGPDGPADPVNVGTDGDSALNWTLIGVGGAALLGGAVVTGIYGAEVRAAGDGTREPGAQAQQTYARDNLGSGGALERRQAGVLMLGGGAGLLIAGLTQLAPTPRQRAIALWTELGVGVTSLAGGIALMVVSESDGRILTIANAYIQDVNWVADHQSELDRYALGGGLTGFGAGLVVGSLLNGLAGGWTGEPWGIRVSTHFERDQGHVFISGGF